MQEQLEDIVKEVNNIDKISDAKNDALIVSSDDEGKPLTFLKKLKCAGVVESVAIDKDGKLDIKLNENFCGTIDFCGDLTSYKRHSRQGEVLNRTGPFAIERPFGNEIIIDVFEELLNKIKKHNNDKNKEKQIQFVAVPGNHEFLGFQGLEDNLAVVGKYKEFQIDPVDGMQALKIKLRGAKVIADIQKYFFEQVKNNGEEKDIVDDDYGDGETKIGDKINNLTNYIKKVQGVIDDIESNKMQDINEDIQSFKDKYNGTSDSINGLELQKLNVLQWNKSHLLSKIVFCHNGKKFRTLHSFALFAQEGAGNENDVFCDDDKKITANNQKEHFGKNLNQNIVNIYGVNRKSFPDKKVFKNNKISTFVGHEGTRDVKYQTEKVFCVDEQGYNSGAVLFIVDNNCIQGYYIQTGQKIKDEFKKIETYDVEKEKEKMYVKIQSNIRRHLARKKYQAKKKNAVKIQSNIRRYLVKNKFKIMKKEHNEEEKNKIVDNKNNKKETFEEMLARRRKKRLEQIERNRKMHRKMIEFFMRHKKKKNKGKINNLMKNHQENNIC